jgi:hypothetical protein
MGAAQHKYERRERTSLEEVRSVYEYHYERISPRPLLPVPGEISSMDKYGKVVQATLKIPALGSYFVASAKTPAAPKMYRTLSTHVASVLFKLEHYGSDVYVRNLNDNPPDDWSKHQLEFLGVYCDDVIDGVLIQTKLVKALRRGGILSVSSQIEGSSEDRSNVISDVVKTQCLQYLGTVVWFKQSEVLWCDDFFMYIGEDYCKERLFGEEHQQYIEQEQLSSEDRHSRGHRRQRTELAVLMDKLPLYTINRLLLPSERAYTHEIPIIKLDVVQYVGYSDMCETYLLNSHNVSKLDRWTLVIPIDRSSTGAFQIKKMTFEAQSDDHTDSRRSEIMLSALLQKLEKKNIQWMVVTGDLKLIYDNNSGHANLMIIDITAKKWYRYEPWGDSTGTPGEEFQQAIDARLSELCKSVGFTYVSPQTIFGAPGPQNRNIKNLAEDTVLSPPGWCQTWSLWFLHVILTKQRVGDLISANSESVHASTDAPLCCSAYIPVSGAEFSALYKRMEASIRPHRHLNCFRYNCRLDSADRLRVAQTYFITAFAASMAHCVFPEWDGESELPLEVVHRNSK